MNDKLDTLDKKMSILKLVDSQREVFSHLLHHAYQAYHSYHASVACDKTFFLLFVHEWKKLHTA